MAFLVSLSLIMIDPSRTKMCKNYVKDYIINVASPHLIILKGMTKKKLQIKPF